MHRDEQFIYGLLCLMSLGFYFVVIPWQIEEPDWVTVSPALLPRVCAILVFVLALLKLVTSFSSPVSRAMVTRANYTYLIGVLLIIALATLTMYWVGFWISMAGTLLVLQLIAQQRNPFVLIAFTAAMTGCSWLLLDLAGLYIIAPY